ncbi:MAG: hypothetical protein VX905_02735 [Actinomycetota bacterium]|nr:hypothetical protein [Actinomycetota bacterium]
MQWRHPCLICANNGANNNSANNNGANNNNANNNNANNNNANNGGNHFPRFPRRRKGS